jgi:hypothetical protein
LNSRPKSALFSPAWIRFEVPETIPRQIQSTAALKDNLSWVAARSKASLIFLRRPFFYKWRRIFNFTANLNSVPGLSRKSRAALCARHSGCRIPVHARLVTGNLTFGSGRTESNDENEDRERYQAFHDAFR